MKSKVSLVLIAATLFVCTATIQAEMVKHNKMKVDNEIPFNCMECHSGSMVPGGAECKADCGTLLSHPNFKKYPPINREKEFLAVEKAQREGIRFYKGEVACTSCHNLLSGFDYFLVQETVNGKLCKSCHLTLFK